MSRISLNKDITGEIFGVLMVEEYIKTIKGKGRIWRCRCTLCGSVCEKPTFYLNQIKDSTWAKCCKPFEFKEGKLIGKLTLVADLGPIDIGRKGGKKVTMWLCRCSCGILTTKAATDIVKNHVESCGCQKIESCKSNGSKRKTHGASSPKASKEYRSLYSRWNNMRRRCSDPKNKHYHCYGGRGVTVCAEWLESFEVFRDWSLGNGYRSNLTLDRINNDGNYEPGNCRWVTTREQMNNVRKNRIVYIPQVNMEMTLAQAVRMYGRVCYSAVYNRMKKGQDIWTALTTPPVR